MLELDTQNFQHEVLEYGQPALVYFFSAVGCAPCKILIPVIEKLAEECLPCNPDNFGGDVR